MKVIRISALLGILVLLASCTSAPKPTIRRTSDDCLVLIRTTIVSSEGAPRDRKYRFLFSDGIPSAQVPSKDEGYVAILVRKPKVKVTGITSTVGGNSTGEASSTTLELELPYKYGEIIVAPFAFAQSISKTGERTFTSSIEFIETPPEAITKLIERYRREHPDDGW
jgi:hypothetical protein